MKKRLAIFGVIAALLMLAACSAAAPEYGTEQTQEQEQIVLHLSTIRARRRRPMAT